MLIICLVIAVLSVFIGAVIAFYTLRSDPVIFSILTGFTASTVVGLVGFYLIPHLYEDLGWISLLIMAAGFLPIFLIERISHHNPRFPIQNHRWVADLTVIGLSVHALTDGFNLAIASQNEELGIGLAIVILVHHLPIAFVLTLVFLSDNTLIATIGRRLPFGSRLYLSLRLGIYRNGRTASPALNRAGHWCCYWRANFDRGIWSIYRLPDSLRRRYAAECGNRVFSWRSCVTCSRSAFRGGACSFRRGALPRSAFDERKNICS